MSTDHTSDKIGNGVWAMGVGEREQSLQFLEHHMKDAGGSLRSLLDRIRRRNGMDLTVKIGKALAAIDLGGVAIPYVEPETYKDARTDLPSVFVSPHDVMRHRGTPYTLGALAELERTLPNTQQRQRLLQEGYGLVAGPPDVMLPFELCQSGSTRASQYIPLDRMIVDEVEKVRPRWYMIKLAPEQDSAGKALEVAKTRHLKIGERLPYVAEIAWFAAMMRTVYDKMLYLDVDVYTASSFSTVYAGNGRHPDEGQPLTFRGIQYDWSGRRGYTFVHTGDYHYVDVGMKTARQYIDELPDHGSNVGLRQRFARQCVVPMRGI